MNLFDQAKSPPQSARDRHARLCREIDQHNRAYYIDAAPTISDFDYDQLYKELEALEEQHPALLTPESPTQRVGAAPISEFAPYQHDPAMQSLDNVYSPDELDEYFQRTQKLLPNQPVDYTVEPKIDGVAVSLRYENGVFARGGTRGDGRQGDDVSHNLRTIRQLPLKLSSAPENALELRGEVYMDFKGFEQMNQKRELEGEPPFANPRNASAGTLKMLDSRTVAQRPLRIVLYGVGDSSDSGSQTQKELLEKLKSWGLPTHDWFRLCHTPEEVRQAVLDLEKEKDTFPFPTDGAVIKVNRFELRHQLGSTSKAPRWAIAYKFSPEQAESILREVSFQVGRTGVITPVANLDPVPLSGTTVSRATLHNFELIRQKDIRVGDTVLIQKAGEIIPEVLEVNLSRRPDNASPITPPTQCPSCSSPLHEDNAFLRCLNEACPEKLKRKLQHFGQRGAMDIEGFGKVLVEQLIDSELVRTLDQIYELKAEQIASLERMGEKSAQNLINGIDASRQRPLWRLLFGLGILHVGAGVARRVEAHFDSLDAIAAATPEQLCEVDDVGEIVAESIHQFFREEETRRLVEALRSHGLNFLSPSTGSSEKGGSPKERTFSQNVRTGGEGPARSPDEVWPFAGLKFVITGTLSQPREHFAALIRQAGGEVSGSVSSKTSYLLAGEKAGSKLKKAREAGVKVLDEEAFLQMLERLAKNHPEA